MGVVVFRWVWGFKREGTPWGALVLVGGGGGGGGGGGSEKNRTMGAPTPHYLGGNFGI